MPTHSLEATIRAARARTDQPLWPALIAAWPDDESTLRDALLDTHGIALIEVHSPRAHLPVQAVQPQGNEKVEALWCQHRSRPLLLAANPWSPAIVQELARRAGAVLALAQPGQIEALLEEAAGGTSPALRADPSVTAAPPVIAFVDAWIARARGEGASDIHFECERDGLRVRLRIDGVMVAADRWPDAQRAEEVISRIMVMAQLDITERRRPQDGRIAWQQAELGSVDLRVSVMPSLFGEDAVLHLLDRGQRSPQQARITLAALGFELELADRIRALAARPHGLLLATGPTSSGKTTTIYAALSESDTGLEKMVTIEDPVEYELPGVLQIPVNENKGLSFASGLRSILRHDPDRILVGEIRDAATAEIAVQASLTGHLVLTTVHANNLFDVLGRFQHFGMDAFGLAASLNGVIVQRLLRRVCEHCIGWRSPTADESAHWQRHLGTAVERLPICGGCAHCRHTGYKGRQVVAEVHALDDEARDLIVQRAPLAELRRRLYTSPQDSLVGQALLRVQRGDTTLDEVRRVVG